MLISQSLPRYDYNLKEIKHDLTDLLLNSSVEILFY